MNTMKAVLAACIVAATIGVVSAPAGATSMSTVESMTGTISDDMTAMSEAGSDFDVAGMESACSDLWGHTATAMGFTRPGGVPRAAWRHTKAAFRLMNDAAAACEQGAADYDADLIEESTDLLEQATSEIELATALLR